MRALKTGERTGSRPQPPEAVARAAPALSPADHWSKSAQLLPGDRAFLPPSSADNSATLTPASGRQDHTTSPYAAPSFVRALFARLTLPRPPHPAPNVRDDRETPLCVGRDGVSFRVDLGWRRSGIFFQAGLDSQLTDLPVGQITRRQHRRRREAALLKSAEHGSALPPCACCVVPKSIGSASDGRLETETVIAEITPQLCDPPLNERGGAPFPLKIEI